LPKSVYSIISSSLFDGPLQMQLNHFGPLVYGR
jgi:hypothetical protein